MITVYVMNIHVHVLVNQDIHIAKSKVIKHEAPVLYFKVQVIHHSPIPYYNLYQQTD